MHTGFPEGGTVPVENYVPLPSANAHALYYALFETRPTTGGAVSRALYVPPGDINTGENVAVRDKGRVQFVLYFLILR